jgi:hypothetical protein
LGNFAGSNLATGNNNIDIGNTGVAAESNTIRIGTEETQTKTFIAGIATALCAAFERAEENRWSLAMGRWLTAYYLFAAGFDSWDFGEIGWELVCGKVFNPHFDQVDEGRVEIWFRFAAAIDDHADR